MSQPIQPSRFELQALRRDEANGKAIVGTFAKDGHNYIVKFIVREGDIFYQIDKEGKDLPAALKRDIEAITGRFMQHFAKAGQFEYDLSHNLNLDQLNFNVQAPKQRAKFQVLKDFQGLRIDLHRLIKGDEDYKHARVADIIKKDDLKTELKATTGADSLDTQLSIKINEISNAVLQRAEDTPGFGREWVLSIITPSEALLAGSNGVLKPENQANETFDDQIKERYSRFFHLSQSIATAQTLQYEVIRRWAIDSQTFYHTLSQVQARYDSASKVVTLGLPQLDADLHNPNATDLNQNFAEVIARLQVKLQATKEMTEKLLQPLTNVPSLDDLKVFEGKINELKGLEKQGEQELAHLTAFTNGLKGLQSILSEVENFDNIKDKISQLSANIHGLSEQAKTEFQALCQIIYQQFSSIAESRVEIGVIQEEIQQSKTELQKLKITNNGATVSQKTHQLLQASAQIMHPSLRSLEESCESLTRHIQVNEDVYNQLQADIVELKNKKLQLEERVKESANGLNDRMNVLRNKFKTIKI